jgi:hypothetical protein
MREILDVTGVDGGGHLGPAAVQYTPSFGSSWVFFKGVRLFLSLLMHVSSPLTLPHEYKLIALDRLATCGCGTNTSWRRCLDNLQLFSTVTFIASLLQ